MMDSRAFWGALAGALWVCACACPPASVDEGVVAVKVKLGQSKAKCVKLFARGDDVSPWTSEPYGVAGKSELNVALMRGSFPAEITVSAVGYGDERCVAPTVPHETASASTQFVARQITRVELVLEARPELDNDQDGYASVASGGDDCDDSNRFVNPGVSEVCDNRRDDDCNAQLDCEQSSCAQQACAQGATCVMAKCAEDTCGDRVDNDGDGALDCADADCNGAPCQSGGTCTLGVCTGTTTELGLCDDGKDNDADGQPDCLDSDCHGQACSDGDPCTTGEKCDALACPRGTAVLCQSPPPTGCYDPVGTCQADGGCRYTVNPANVCTDGRACTPADSCDVNTGQCVGTVRCESPPACRTTVGASCGATGDCNYPIDVGATCSDGDNCTTNDQCSPTAVCQGTQVTCPSRPCEQFTGCASDGTCQYSPTSGQGCGDGGVCVQGSCAQFPYSPSNFAVSELPPVGPSVLLDCGPSIFDSSSRDGGTFVGTWCGRSTPIPTVITQGGIETSILAMSSLTVARNSVLRLQGTRPVILVVFQDAAIHGHLDVGVRGGAPGAGGGACTVGHGRDGTCAPGASCAGGGGAGFGTPGGPGGIGGAAAGGGDAGLGGQVEGADTLVPLRGGCWGGDGAGVTGGRGGVPAGAVQISAAGNLIVSGWVSAAGGQGRGTDGGSSGGGGGASGGAVFLEASTIFLWPGGVVSANGGGGGSGSGSTTAGRNGESGAVDGGRRAAGGAGPTTSGGPGGAGGALLGPDAGGNGSSSSGGGGGGGGAAGRIRLRGVVGCAIDAGAVVSPGPDVSGGVCPP